MEANMYSLLADVAEMKIGWQELSKIVVFLLILLVGSTILMAYLLRDKKKPKYSEEVKQFKAKEAQEEK